MAMKKKNLHFKIFKKFLDHKKFIFLLHLIFFTNISTLGTCTWLKNYSVLMITQVDVKKLSNRAPPVIEAKKCLRSFPFVPFFLMLSFFISQLLPWLRVVDIQKKILREIFNEKFTNCLEKGIKIWKSSRKMLKVP